MYLADKKLPVLANPPGTDQGVDAGPVIRPSGQVLLQGNGTLPGQDTVRGRAAFRGCGGGHVNTVHHQLTGIGQLVDRFQDFVYFGTVVPVFLVKQVSACRIIDIGGRIGRGLAVYLLLPVPGRMVQELHHTAYIIGNGIRGR